MKNIAIILLMACSIMACEKALIPNIETSNKNIFEELWQHVDEHYIYFDVKQVDWDKVYTQYAPLIREDMSEVELFDICAEMLATLKDGHNVLISRDTLNAYDFRTGYEVVFDPEIVRKNYLNNTFEEKGNFTYGIAEGNIGYVHFKDFKGTRDMETVVAFMLDKKVDGLVFDIRSNGGGRDAERIVKYFIQEPTLVGYNIEKTGKGHTDFSENLSFIVQPDNDLYFDKPVKILINRGSFSASTYFAGMMKHLPNSTLIGQITGGGGGGNAAYQLPNDWLVWVSVSTFLDVNLDDIEVGVTPHIDLNNDPEKLANGVDEILERAMEDF